MTGGGGCGNGGADIRRRSEAVAESEARGEEGETSPWGNNVCLLRSDL